MLQREQPWNLRQANAKHYQWYKNLVQVQELTNAWINDLHHDHEEHNITRGLSKDVTENIWMLKSLVHTDLDSILDDTKPEDTLGRLESTVWIFQAWTIMSLMEKTPEADRPALDSILEQTSWRVGRAYSEQHWLGMKKEIKEDLRSLVLAITETPFLRPFQTGSFLVKRAVSSEVQLELCACPHRLRFPEVKAVADLLCRYHSHWLRGFAYGLNNRIVLDHKIGSPRCSQRWNFAQ